MTKYLSRVFGSYVEDKLLIQFRIQQCSMQTEEPFENLFMEWRRGDTLERSECFGNITPQEQTVQLNVVFNKLSIFYRKEAKDIPEY
jgi:hypothetical protein